MLTIAEIRRQYPHPIRAYESNSEACSTEERLEPDGEYCVAGAIYMSVTGKRGRGIAFPMPAAAARALAILNPRLSPGEAYALAVDIIAANDCENFEEAWLQAEQATDGELCREEKE